MTPLVNKVILLAGPEVPYPQSLYEALIGEQSSGRRSLTEDAPYDNMALVSTQRGLVDVLQSAVSIGERESADTQTLDSQPAKTSKIVVIPLSTGRDLHTVTYTAQTMRWVKQQHPEVYAGLYLTPPLADGTQTIAAIRQGIRQATRQGYKSVAVCSAPVDPFADAELFRRARLAWQYSSGVHVDVCFTEGTYPSLGEVEKKNMLLGLGKPYIIRGDYGGFYRDPDSEREEHVLWRPKSIKQAIHSAVQEAWVHGQQGIDGIEWGLGADHDQGFAHSHGDEEHSHQHGHSHPHPHNHGHSHSHSHGHNHSHGHDHAHAHLHGHNHGHSHHDSHSHEPLP